MNREVKEAMLKRLQQLDAMKALLGPYPTIEQLESAATSEAAELIKLIARCHTRLSQMSDEVVSSESHEWDTAKHSETALLLEVITHRRRQQEISARQRKNAAAPRKIDDNQRKRIALAYEEAVRSGEGHGAQKALAREYGVSRGTIATIIKENAEKRNAQ